MPRYQHLFLAGPNLDQRFSSPRRGGDSPRLTDRNRAGHAAAITQAFQAAWAEGAQIAENYVDRSGVYLDFYSEPGFDLVIKSLEVRRSGIRLLNVRVVGAAGEEVTRATVFVPRAKSALFLRKVAKYANELDPRSGEPKNKKLIESITEIRSSVIESFWQDRTNLMPADAPDWVEAWLSSEDLGVIGRFHALCQELQIEIGEGQLTFPERTVLFLRANRAQLAGLLERSDSIAEFRATREVAAFFTEQQNNDQAVLVGQILARVRAIDGNQVAVLVLDHGINNGHALLGPLLADADRHTVNPAWGTADDHGHGTRMAGTVAYGDLLQLLQSDAPILITHRLESAKILPPPPAVNPKQFWGHLTSRGISYAEIQAPQRKRIICMAITAAGSGQRGRPSSWSGQIDELASGYNDDTRRLFIISAGNVREAAEWRTYPAANKTSEVEDPAQAWNALTVGACTTKTVLTDPTMAGYTVLAEAGDLSPFSTTSLTWPARKWPIKPEVLFEGGNVAIGPNNSILDHDDLKLLSTYHDTQVAHFAPFDKTSAACAQAAWMAARIQAAYPAAWPETVRALIVHSADWSDRQKQSFLEDQSKASYAKLARICGYGVPSLERALYCAENSLTLVAQAELQPFDHHQTESRYVSRDMHLYRLPWPAEVLEGLGEVPVKLRVTLSYFVEPSPGEIGWQNRYRYASFGLRFEVNGPGENEGDFLARVNRLAREDDEHPGTEGPGERWTIGEARNVGSIHSDIWTGTAADLATSHLLAIYPAVGWWRERHHLHRWDKTTRYSLLVSIHLPVQNVDIYTPVAVQVGIPVPVPIAVPWV
jgi:hypothetical protein